MSACFYRLHACIGCAGKGAKRQRVGSGKAAKAAVEAAMAAADPEQAAANKAAEKAAKAAARREKAAAKGKAKKAADSVSGNSNVWGPYEAPSDEEVDPEALVKSKVCVVLTCVVSSWELLPVMHSSRFATQPRGERSR